MFARDRWHVIGPDNIPIYNDAQYGNDKPIIFKDEDAALECAERCNTDYNQDTSIWNRCDVCGRFISFNAFDCGNAVRKMVTPDSEYSAEDYTTLCEKHRDI